MTKDRVALADILLPQSKSKIKAGEGKSISKYKFFTSSNSQSKFINEYQYDCPALIFGTGGHASIHFCDEKFSTSTDCLVFYAEEACVLKYIYHYLSGKPEILERGFKGEGIKHISKQYILNISLCLPEVTEQRRIVMVLDKVSDLIAKHRQQLEKLHELINARFVEMFGDPAANTKGWRILPMSDVCSVSSSKRIYQSDQSSKGIPFWRISDLTDVIRTGTATPKLYIPVERYEELKAYGQVPVAGDILLSSRGTLGQCYVVKEGDKFYFQDGMISWLSKYTNEVTPLYISHLFAMSGVQKQIDAVQAGSSVAYLSIAMIKLLKVMLPPLVLQNRFASFVERVEKMKTKITYGLERLETLKATLMQTYFG